jgi:hypothetical protein
MKINKCPFCGEEDAEMDYSYDYESDEDGIKVWWIICVCGAMSMNCDTEEEAIIAWNKVSEKVYG